MWITETAARNLITSRNPDMTVEVAMAILKEAASTATLLDERTESGELYFAVPDLGGRLIVKDTDPEFKYVVVAFARDRKKPASQADVSVAKEIIRASVASEKK